MAEAKRGDPTPTPFVRYVQTAVEALDFQNNPSASQILDNEAEIIGNQNPLVEAVILNASRLYPQFRNMYLWGATTAYRALRIRAASLGEDMPRLTASDTNLFQGKVLPVVRKLSMYANNPRRNRTVVTATEEERELILGKFQKIDPEASDYFWKFLGGNQLKDRGLEILRETHPGYLGFAFVFLMFLEAGKKKPHLN